MWRSDPKRDSEPISFMAQKRDRGREQFTSLRTEAAMSGKRAAILTGCGYGPKVVLEAKNLRSAQRRGGGGFVKTSSDKTTTDGADAGGLASPPFFPLAGRATA